jgi:hypothetical protein
MNGWVKRLYERRQGEKLIFFGASSAYDKFTSHFNISPDYCVDNDSRKWGLKHNDIKIQSPDALRNEQKGNVFIVITSSFAAEISSQLERYGFQEGEDYIDGLALLKQIYCKRISGFNRHVDSHVKVLKGGDVAGQVLVDPENRRIFRGINPDFESLVNQVYQKFEQSPSLQAKIIDTKKAEQHLPTYAFVLEHEWIPNITYPYEWSPTMFYDAAVFLTDLMETLHRHQLGTKDAHPLNVAYHNGRWVWIDFCSIIPMTTPFIAIQEFVASFIHPLIMLSKNNTEKVYMYFKNPKLGFAWEDIKGYLSEDEQAQYTERMAALRKHYHHRDMSAVIANLKDWLTQYVVAVEEDETWSQYHDNLFEISDRNEWPLKNKYVVDFIHSKKPDRLLDLAGASGWYCFAASQIGIPSVLIDSNIQCINKCYERMKQTGIYNITPIYGDFIEMTPAMSIGYTVDERIFYPQRPSFKARFRSDMVLALAIVHHLVFSAQLTFEEIISQISEVSSNYLVIEFISTEDIYVSQWYHEGFDWYTRDNFEKVLSTQYEILDVKDDHFKGRLLYFCRKRLQHENR